MVIEIYLMGGAELAAHAAQQVVEVMPAHVQVRIVLGHAQGGIALGLGLHIHFGKHSRTVKQVCEVALHLLQYFLATIPELHRLALVGQTGGESPTGKAVVLVAQAPKQGQQGAVGRLGILSQETSDVELQQGQHCGETLLKAVRLGIVVLPRVGVGLCHKSRGIHAGGLHEVIQVAIHTDEEAAGGVTHVFHALAAA